MTLRNARCSDEDREDFVDLFEIGVRSNNSHIDLLIALLKIKEFSNYDINMITRSSQPTQTRRKT